MIGLRPLVVLILIFALYTTTSKSFSGHSQTPPEALTLDASNFTTFAPHIPLLLVNYYATWCGFCKTLNEEMRFVVKELTTENIPARIAFVDASVPENEALAGPLGLNGYPSLILYRHGQRVGDYLGGRSRSELLAYLRRKSGPAVEPVASMDEVRAFMDALVEPGYLISSHSQQQTPLGTELSDHNTQSTFSILTLGLFLPAPRESGRGPYGRTAEAFTAAANTMDQTKFLIADNLNIVRHFGVTQDTMIVFTGGKAGHTALVPLNETMDSDMIAYQLLTLSIPPVITYDASTQPYLRTLLIKVHVLLFHDESSSSEEFISAAEELSLEPEFRGRFVFIKVSNREHQLMQVFGLQAKDLPEAVIADMSDPLNMRRFGYIDHLLTKSGGAPIAPPNAGSAAPAANVHAHAIPKDLSKSSLSQFLSLFLAGQLTRSLFSEDPVEVEKQLHASRAKLRPSRTYNVRVAVGGNFKQVVTSEPPIDQLVYIFVPWCAHCKSFEPVFAELASKHQGDHLLQFVRIDGSKNELDHPVVRIRGYPAIYLFRAHDKAAPIEYDGVRSASALSSFLAEFRNSGKFNSQTQ